MFIDSHAHIDGPEFDGDRLEVIKRAAEAGVTTILNVGTGDPHSGTFERAAGLAANHKDIYAAIGVHPHDAKLYDDAAEARIHSLIDANLRSWHGEKSDSITITTIHRAISNGKSFRDNCKRLNLRASCHNTHAQRRRRHDRDSTSRTSAIVSVVTGRHHALLRRIIGIGARRDRPGFYISFSGNITFKKAEDLRKLRHRFRSNDF